MQSRMQPSYYSSSVHFEKEQSRIFRSLWIFAGFSFAAAKKDQFFTREIGGVPVLLQHIDGKIRGFVNSCAHRGAKLQTEDFGTRPLICGYHGWRYDSNGSACHIPFEEKFFKFDRDQRQNLKLNRVHVAEIGSFVFVNLSENPLPIEKQFSGKVRADLESISSSLDTEISVSKVESLYNWKLPFENLRDSLHPLFVHPKSLSLDVNFEPNMEVMNYESKRSECELIDLSYGGAEGKFKKKFHQPFHDFVERWGSEDAYFNWLLYPNTHIASPDGGHIFTIEHYHPVAPGKTVLINYWVATKKKKSYATARVLWEHTLKARDILDEDASIMEATQAGLNSQSPNLQLGIYEADNKRNESWYLKHMGLADA